VPYICPTVPGQWEAEVHWSLVRSSFLTGALKRVINSSARLNVSQVVALAGNP